MTRNYILQEEGDILSGKVLCYSAMIRCGVFSAGSMDTQKSIVAELFNNMKTRSYLPLLTFKIFTDGIDSVSDLTTQYKIISCI